MMKFLTLLKIAHFISINLALALVFYLFHCLTNRSWDINKGKEPYECGYQRQDFGRKPINIHFFILCLVFLIFDLELITRLPIVRILQMISSKGIAITLVFFIIINIGYLIEWSNDVIKT